MWVANDNMYVSHERLIYTLHRARGRHETIHEPNTTQLAVVTRYKLSGQFCYFIIFARTGGDVFSVVEAVLRLHGKENTL